MYLELKLCSKCLKQDHKSAAEIKTNASVYKANVRLFEASMVIHLDVAFAVSAHKLH